MPIEPPRKISETQIIRREDGAGYQKKKKPASPKNEQKPEEKNVPEKTGKIDIRI